MHVAMIEPVGGHGGNDIYDFNLVRSIGKSGNCSATLYTCDETIINGVMEVKLTYKNIFGKTNKFVRAFNYIAGTFRSLIDAKKSAASIVHLHIFGFNSREYLNLFLAKKLFRFPVAATIHDVESLEKYADDNTARHDYEKFLSLLDAVVVHTEYARTELLAHMTPEVVNTVDIRTIYACDLDYDNLSANGMDKDAARKHLDLPHGRKIILFFGQIKKVKGLDVLLQALSVVCRQEESVLLVIAGKVWKDDFSAYDAIIQKLRLQAYVDLRIGFIRNEDVPYYFNAADVIALPYKKIYNSGVLIRAMSFGTPVVASNFGPFSEFIRDGENGYLFETGNETMLAAKLIELLGDESALESTSHAEKEFINKNFDLDEIGKQYCQMYQGVLRHKTGNEPVI